MANLDERSTMATVMGPPEIRGDVLDGTVSVALPGPERSTACPFCGCVVEVRWVVWDRKKMSGPRGGRLKRPQLPFVVEPRVEGHECSAVNTDPRLPLRQEISYLNMLLRPFADAPPSPEEKEALENLIAEKLAELQDADRAAATP